jgi:hypothetical protein
MEVKDVPQHLHGVVIHSRDVNPDHIILGDQVTQFGYRVVLHTALDDPHDVHPARISRSMLRRSA